MYTINTKYWQDQSLNIQEKFIMNEVAFGLVSDLSNDKLRKVLQVSDPTITRLFKGLIARKYISYEVLKGNVRIVKALK